MSRNTFLNEKCTKHSSFGQLLKVRMSKELHAIAGPSTFASQNVKNTPASDSSDVQELYAAVARSTIQSQNVKNMRGSGHFLKCGCRKIARRCGAKHISKSKCCKRVRAIL